MNHIDSFLYVRHGQTDWNAQGLMQFHSDIPLNETGQNQAQEAARKLAKLSGERLFFLYSPYSRATETASIIADHLHHRSDVEVVGFTSHDGLKERFGGTLDQMPHADLEEKAKGLIPENEFLFDHLKLFCPKAECSLELVKRVQESLHFGYKQAQEANAKLIIVAHLGAFSTFGRLKLGQPEEVLFKNATPYLFVNEGDDKMWLIEELE
jgi:broad specificity phosphatase PhoE